MKHVLALPCVALLAVGVAACSSASKAPTGATARTQSTQIAGTALATQTRADADKDNDFEAPFDDKNHNSTLTAAGREAAGPERRTITDLLERYYTAAYAADGARACSMLYSTFAESVPEDYGQSPPGPPYMKGSTCSEALTKGFRYLHPLLALEVPKLEVAHVRVNERRALAILRFGSLPERQINLRQESHKWKLVQILDNFLE